MKKMFVLGALASALFVGCDNGRAVIDAERDAEEAELNADIKRANNAIDNAQEELEADAEAAHEKLEARRDQLEAKAEAERRELEAEADAAKKKLDVDVDLD